MRVPVAAPSGPIAPRIIGAGLGAGLGAFLGTMVLNPLAGAAIGAGLGGYFSKPR